MVCFPWCWWAHRNQKRSRFWLHCMTLQNLEGFLDQYEIKSPLNQASDDDDDDVDWEQERPRNSIKRLSGELQQRLIDHPKLIKRDFLILLYSLISSLNTGSILVAHMFTIFFHIWKKYSALTMTFKFWWILKEEINVESTSIDPLKNYNCTKHKR